MTCLLTAFQRLTGNNYKQSKSMAHPHHCLVTQKLQSTYFKVLYAYFIIGPNVRSHCGLTAELLVACVADADSDMSRLALQVQNRGRRRGIDHPTQLL